MKKAFLMFLSVVMVAFLLPYLISGIISYAERQAISNISPKEGDAVTAGSFVEPFLISVYFANENKVKEIELEEYLAGVLAGEMPPTNHSEALKAQAVAARSYILSKVADYSDGNIADSHNGAMVCTDYKHCKAWKSIDEIKPTWDERFADDYETKIRYAINDTSGEYMIYDNKVVKAYFYAISSGRTENVAEVWGTSLPYLKSVVSREDVGSFGYESMSTYPKDLFLQKLRTVYGDIQIDDTANMVGRVNRTEGGSVSVIEIGGKEFKGDKIRELFDLRSANFELSADGDKITFRVLGYGHGVGMSQNGANVMANEGKSYIEILKHYYTGVSIVNLYKNV